jgi:hypothetical protein
VLVATGIEDINEMKSHLSDDQGMYALYRSRDQVDDIETVKFTFIQWQVLVLLLLKYSS